MDLAVAATAHGEQVLFGVECAPGRIPHVMGLGCAGCTTPLADAAATLEDDGPDGAEAGMSEVLSVGSVGGRGANGRVVSRLLKLTLAAISRPSGDARRRNPICSNSGAPIQFVWNSIVH